MSYRHPLPWPLTPVLVFLVLISLQMWLLGGLPYRLDETWRLHIAVVGTPADVLRHMFDVNAPLYSLLLHPWVRLVGHHEVTSRYFSHLTLLITMAVSTRFLVDLAGRLAGIYINIVLLSFPFVAYYVQDASPYPLYLCCVASSTFYLWRWLRTERTTYALVYFFVGLAGIYTHYFFVFTIMLHFVWLLVSGWGRPRMIAFGIYLQLMIGVAIIVGWGTAVYNQYVLIGSLDYNRSSFFSFLALQFGAETIGLGGLSLFLMVNALRPDKMAPRVRIVSGLFLGVTLAQYLLLRWVDANVWKIATERNLMFIYFPLAVVIVVGIHRMGNYAPLAALVIFSTILARVPLRPAPVDTLAYFIGSGELVDEIRPTYTPGHLFVVEQGTSVSRAFIHLNYFLLERLGVMPQNILYFSPDYKPDTVRLPVPPQTAFTRADEVDHAILRERLRGAEEVWHIILETPWPGANLVTAYADAGLYQAQAVSFNRYISYQRYSRITGDLLPDLTFNNEIALLDWEVSELSLPVCASLDVNTGWRLTGDSASTYSMNLSLAGTNGTPIATVNRGITNTVSAKWITDIYYMDERRLIVPCDTPPGSYNLVFVVDGIEGVSTVATPDGYPQSSLTYLTTIEITATLP